MRIKSAIIKRVMSPLLALTLISPSPVAEAAVSGIIAPSATNRVAITQKSGVKGTSDTISNSFIELYNPTGEEVNLEGWRLDYGGGATGSVALSDHSIPAYGYFFIKGKRNFTNGPNMKLIFADDESDCDLYVPSLELDNKNCSLTLYDGNEIVDGYGEGSANSLTPGNWAIAETSKQSVSVRVNYNDAVSDFVRFGFDKTAIPEDDETYQNYVQGGYVPRKGKTLALTGTADPKTIITPNSQWRYIDDGGDPFLSTKLYQMGQEMGYESALNAYRFAWSLPPSPYSDASLDAMAGYIMDIGFDDSAWKTAKGPFGYKNGSAPQAWGEYTPVTGNKPASADRVETYFFRRDFDLTDASWVHSAHYELRYDDAVIIYINGAEIGRHNARLGGYSKNVEYGCESVVGDYAQAVETAAIPSGLLRDGTNTVAVELHQDRSSSSDIYLNFIDFTLSEEYVTSNETPSIQALTFQPGADETSLNFTWLSNTPQAGVLSVTENGGEPVTFNATAESLSQRNGFLTNKAVATGLSPGKTYSYTARNGDLTVGPYTFTTANSTDAFSFLLVGDPQIGSSGSAANDTAGWQGTITKSANTWNDVRFVVSAGDQVETANNEEHYDGYLSPAPLTGLPVAQTVGNHDNSGNYLGHYNPPNLDNDKGATGAGGDYWYGYGNALFMHINSNNLSAAQHKEFLKNAIAAYKTQRGGADPAWKIVVFHHSVYSTASHTTDTDILQRRADLPPIFAELGIDAVLSGHDHVYTRSLMMNGVTPVDEGYAARDGNPYASYVKTVPNETVYLSANSASGSKFYAIKNLDFPFKAVDNQHNKPNVTKIDVSESSMTFTTYSVGAEDTVSDVVDAFALTRGSAPATVTKISVSGGDSIGVKNGTLRLTATVSPSDAADSSVTWTVANGAGATVSEDGVVTATTDGTVTVRATANDGSGVYGEITIEITGQAAPVVTGVTIVLDANGGSVSPISVQSGADGKVSSLPAPTRGGYVFGGWYSRPTGGELITTAAEFTANAVIYAHWVSQAPSYAGSGSSGAGGVGVSVTTASDDNASVNTTDETSGPEIVKPAESPESEPETESTIIIMAIASKEYTVNGNIKVMDVAPFIRDGYTMAPLRFIAEALGAEVAWDDATKTVTITYEGEKLDLVIDRTDSGMPVAPFIIDSRAFAPTRYIFEYFDASVSWDGVLKTVAIEKVIRK
ncbi:MAG: Ig-like domain-containing protein [Clostridiales bacterium]|jgi:uncharacterized repeat protein (TIGR02543 family)|nr:Ig-like domain-containing protein [Clostridiales bacterium]